MDNEEAWKALESYGYPSKSGLDYINNFTFLVAILLSAQAQDAFINTQTSDFWHAAPDAEKMHDLGVDAIAGYIRRIGLWRNKAQNIYKLANQILELKKIKDQQAWYDELLSLIHISEPTRRTPISYAVFCLKKGQSWGRCTS